MISEVKRADFKAVCVLGFKFIFVTTTTTKKAGGKG